MVCYDWYALCSFLQERNQAKEAYIKRAKSINRATVSSSEAAKEARKKLQEERFAQAEVIRRERESVLATDRDRRFAEANARLSTHRQVHSSKFVSLASIKTTPDRLKPYFSFRSPASRRKPHEVRI